MADLQISEGSKYEALSGVQKEIQDLKESHANSIALYQSQIEMLKDKIQPSTKKEEVGSLVQRDAVIKQIKKENALLKTKVEKIKGKNKELKI